ncbi:mannose-1-phosphate guanylyltransferase/mannose-6-phosphate isomerase [Pusillimonas sp. NJUB218]|uniref:mannose-1-phosphate guanylyltransferase/mannose-6-phosphate isomerase n=1 Tax=Pusillimonas sp. NJUB218 TaxID=2023230 RepID=UPI000F4CBC94|nr:mannose-1-phosphate guanylyltransferase/mannose-6-phosphate isomerase [Pusillimonas sp. NJUB218]ROT44766.1 mannose-1-phosphate guanylyltransferase/mannose-6-phosphate isomerase [Pusillimonas sp. NJUB218]
MVDAQALELRAVLLVGGSGTRLWPMSRAIYPKQFLPILDGHSPLEQTFRRLAGLTSAQPIAVANEEHRFIVAEQLRQVGYPDDGTILLEPAGRNTAPAVALAALLATRDESDAVLLVLPSDHVVRDPEAFTRVVSAGLPAAAAGKFVTFGVKPQYPETGYGYIQIDPTPDASDELVFAVQQFTEKPDAARAAQFLQQGNYYWNSGMFLFRASSYLQALEQFRPDILSACRQAMSDLSNDGDFTRINASAFQSCPSDSIDYAIMERIPDAAMVELDAGWSDIGSWEALHQLSEKDADGNVLMGDVLATSCSNVYASGSDRLLALLGLQNLVVVDTPDAVLVAARDQVQNVRDIVTILKAQGRSEAVSPHRVLRPWGYYESVDFGERFQVKRITVHPGGRLSMQLHHHRAEHWIVVRGTAQVTRGEETFLLGENQSAYIPLGIRHRLENPGSIPLEVIEVQSGSYLGEDDIVRFDDAYGR